MSKVRDAILNAIGAAFEADAGDGDVRIALPKGRPGPFQGSGPSYDRVWRGITNGLKVQAVSGVPMSTLERQAAALASIRGAVRFVGGPNAPALIVKAGALAEARKRVRRAASVYAEHARTVRREGRTEFWTRLEPRAAKGKGKATSR